MVGRYALGEEKMVFSTGIPNSIQMRPQMTYPSFHFINNFAINNDQLIAISFLINLVKCYILFHCCNLIEMSHTLAGRYYSHIIWVFFFFFKKNLFWLRVCRQLAKSDLIRSNPTCRIGSVFRAWRVGWVTKFFLIAGRLGSGHKISNQPNWTRPTHIFNIYLKYIM